MGKKILYYKHKSSPKKLSLPFPFDKTFSFKVACKEDYPLVVLDEKVLRKKLNSIRLKSKICIVHFSKVTKNNLQTVKKFDFFDYITDEDTKAEVMFKLQRARNFLACKHRLAKLEGHLLKKNEKIEEITLVDPLTGCYNWRYFLNRAQQELNRSRRHLHGVSFIGVDIDNFRQINEIYGVKVADQVAKDLVAILNSSLRKEDVLSRWRGDEFFIVAPHLENKNVHKVAQRIKSKITSYKFTYKKISLSVRASIGIVSSPEDNIFNIREITNALSRCISAAKRKGGDAIIFYSQSKFKSVTEKESKEDVAVLRKKIEKMNVLLARDLMEMIYGFARTIEAKDSYTGRHVEYTAVLAEAIAKAFNLPPEEIENIKHAAVLHDLGKVGIDGQILSKRGPLTPKEREIIKTHPSIAAEILREIHGLRGAVPAVLYHHERYDGQGYPLGLKGEEIPLGARIVAIADVFQALVSDRPYRRALGKKKALEIIKKESGKQFDPKIVSLFLKIVKDMDIDGKR